MDEIDEIYWFNEVVSIKLPEDTRDFSRLPQAYQGLKTFKVKVDFNYLGQN